MTVQTNTDHRIVSREEWITARKKLLEEEKALTRRSDEVARRRQALPWVRLDKAYRFETDEGSASLADLFRGRSHSSSTISSVSENKGEIRWQQAWRETRNTGKDISE